MSTDGLTTMKTPMLTNTGLGMPIKGPEPPIRNLAFGILLQALRDLWALRKASRRGNDQENWRADAAQWIFSEETGPGSFHWVCGVLGISAGALREKLRVLEGADCKRREELFETLSRVQMRRSAASG